MIKIINGDITKTSQDIIIQQVNCKGLMGAGLALTIMNKYRNVKKEYQEFRKNQMRNWKSEKELLGLVNYVRVYDGKIIANIFGQEGIRKGHNDTKVYTDKEALLRGIHKVKDDAEENELTVAIPTYIGCGLAGGNWKEIKQGIEDIFQDTGVDVVFYHYR